MSRLADALAPLARVLEGTRWYVFGAQAIAAHGVPRSTQDLDVTVCVDAKSLRRIVVSLESVGFAHRFPVHAEELMAAGAVLPLRHLPTAFEVDLVVGRSGLEELAATRATSLRLDGVAVPVASATDLVVMKVLAGRARDLDDVRGLIAVGRVDVAEALTLLGELEQALGQSDLSPRLRSLLA